VKGIWPAVAWFALAVFATAMLLRSLQPAGSLRPVHPAQWMLPRPAVPPQWHSQTTGPEADRSAPPKAGMPAAAVQTGPTVGTQLIKCAIHGQVTYTNDPQECQDAAQSGSVTVYPTRGVRPEAQSSR
jgi:hypothetical protein